MIVKVVGKFRDGSDKKTIKPSKNFAYIKHKTEDIFSKLIALGRNDTEENWRDATQEEYDEWELRQEEEQEEAEEDV